MEPSTLTTASETFRTPEWVKDAVFYQIFPDRFARSTRIPKPSNLEPWDSPPTIDGFKGGDLLGVIEHLDYLQDLEITALYFCPIFQSTANHRYHTQDYYTIDPILGGNEAFDQLLAAAHARDMHVIIDGVFNHASRGFYQFNSILENGQAAPYLDWFLVRDWPLHPYGPADQPPNYECWWGLPALPKFNTGTLAVREFLWTVGEHWIGKGIDGWRLDVPNEIDDDEFWREFRNRVKGQNANAYLVGEIWDDARRWLQGDQFDAVMNYVFTRACLGFFAGQGAGIDQDAVRGSGLFPLEVIDAPAFRTTIDALLHLYPEQASLTQLNLLGSHDTPRFLTTARGDVSSLRLATLFQMTYPGAPCIYYGDEIGMQGGRDPDCRRSFPWDRSAWNQDLRDFVRECIHLRHRHRVLRRGTFTSLTSDGNVYVYSRDLGQDRAIIAINAGSEARAINLEAGTGSRGQEWCMVLGTDFPEVVEGTIRNWRLSARSGTVLLTQQPSV